MTTQLPVWSTITASWEKVYGAKQTFWGAILTIVAIMIGISLIVSISTAISKPLGMVLSFISQIIYLLFTAGLVYIGLQRALDTPISFNMIFYTLDWKMGFKVILLYILQFVVMLPLFLIFLGILFFNTLIYLISPDIIVNTASGITKLVITLASILVGFGLLYVYVRLSVALCFLLQQKVHPWEAIVLSFRATRHNFWRLVGVFVLLWLIIMISIIPLGIGLIWTLPMGYICFGMIYKTLSANANNTIVVR